MTPEIGVGDTDTSHNNKIQRMDQKLDNDGLTSVDGELFYGFLSCLLNFLK